MGIVNPYMVKNAIGKTAGQTLELEADPGQSFLVKNILIGDNDATMTDITVDKAMVGRFRTAKSLGNHLGFPLGMNTSAAADVIFKTKPKSTILEYLDKAGHFMGFPIAEGQKMVISPAVATEYLGDVTIVYEEHEGGDISSEDENGSDSSEYMIINYGDTGAAITAAATTLVSSQNSPSEVPQFPFGKVVPAKTEIELIGILASDAYDWDDSTHISYTTYLKFVRERTVLFDDDRNGMLFKGGIAGVLDVQNYFGHGNSKLGNYSDIDVKEPYMLKEPIVFGAGEELNIYITSAIVTNAASIAQDGGEIGLIMKIRRVS